MQCPQILTISALEWCGFSVFMNGITVRQSFSTDIWNKINYIFLSAGLPILSDFRIKRINDNYVTLVWDTACVPECDNISYKITYSLKQLAPLSHAESVEQRSIVLESSPATLHLESECEYHMAIVVNCGLEYGPPSREISFIIYELYPKLVLDIHAESTGVSITILPYTDPIDPKKPTMRYEIIGVRDSDRKDIWKRMSTNPTIRIERLTSNHYYEIHAKVCYLLMENYISCSKTPFSKNFTTLVEAPDLVNVDKEFTKADIIEWKPPNQSFFRGQKHVKVELPDYYEVKVQSNDTDDKIVQIDGTKCTPVQLACNTGKNIYFVRAVIIQKGLQLKPRGAVKAPVVCREEISIVKEFDRNGHIPGEWKRLGEEECPLSTQTISTCVVIALLSVLIGVFMTNKKYKKIIDIDVELPSLIREITQNPQPNQITTKEYISSKVISKSLKNEKSNSILHLYSLSLSLFQTAI